MVIDKNILFEHYNPVYEQFKYFEKSDLSNMIPSARTLTLSSIDPYHACHFPYFFIFSFFGYLVICKWINLHVKSVERTFKIFWEELFV